MMGILDKFPSSADFVPNSVQEYFALQLARKLQDLSNIYYYVQLCQRHSQGRIMSAYRSMPANRPKAIQIERFRSHFNH